MRLNFDEPRLHAEGGDDTMLLMNALKAHVENGRIVVDEPTTLPNGTVLHLVAITESDNVDWEIDAAWREEVQRRSARIRAGEAKTTPWDVARSEIFGR